MALWVFGYGSLLWNPGFEPAETQRAVMKDYHRSFCMLSIHHRGTEEEPGLVLALDTAPGHQCTGVAFRVKEAEAYPLADGTWQLILTIEAKKFEADGDGAQTEVPLDYNIDVGVFTKNLDDPIEGTDHVLHMEKQQIKDGKMEIRLVVTEEPKYAGIDPYNKLIDRNSDDNLRAVDIVEARGS